MPSIQDENSFIKIMSLGNDAVGVGAQQDVQTEVYELFARSAVLVNPPEKLPLLKSADWKSNLHPGIGASMAASGLALCRMIGRLYNGVDLVEDQILSEFYQIIVLTGLVGTGYGYTISECNHFWKPVNPQLLKDSVTLYYEIDFDVVAAGVAFGANLISLRVDLELDWKKISKKQLDDYIVEEIYTEQ